MPLSSADRSFGVIALQRKYVSRDALVAAEKELDARKAQGVAGSLGDLLLQMELVSSRQKAKVEKIRAPHGRHCHACARVTYLLPGENDATKGCEHCGGRLRQRAPEHVLAQGGEGEGDATPTGRIVAIMGGKDPKRETERAQRLQDSTAGLKAVDTDPDLVPDAETPVSPTPPPPRGTRRLGPPTGGRPPSAPTPPAGPDRFAPPPEPGEAPAPGSPPTRRFAIAGLPTGAPHQGPAPAADVPLKPAAEAGFLDEIIGVFGYPFGGLGAAIITVPAILRAMLLGVNGAALALGFSIVVYHVKATMSVVSGDRHPPPRPGLMEMLQLAHVPIVAFVACFAPALLVFSSDVKAFFSAPDDSLEAIVSIGNDAHRKASKTSRWTGVDVSDVVLHDVGGKPVRLGDRAGRWLVLGLLSRRDMTPDETELCARELEDLGRLADATTGKDKDLAVDVAAVWIDPEDTLARGAHTARGTTSLVKLKTRDAALPPPLEDARPSIPTVFLISPRGEVKKEFDHGASDEALFGALLVLQHGGPLGEIRPVHLYSHERGFGAGGLSPLAVALFFLGVLYWPMAVLMTAYGDPVRAFRYHEGIRAILATAGDYALIEAIAGACVVVVLIGRSAAFSLTGLQEGRAFAGWWLGIAGTLAVSSAMGRYFAHNSSEFAWARARVATRPAASPEAPPAETKARVLPEP